MMARTIFVLMGLLLAGGAVAAPIDFDQADRPRDWSFPADHGSHPRFQTEWWYFTGAMRDAKGHQFGYEVTFFRFALGAAVHETTSQWRARDLILGHFTITDVDGQQFYQSEALQRAAAGLAGAEVGSLGVFLGGWSATADADTIRIRAGASTSGTTSHRAELSLLIGRDPVLHGDAGLSWKSADHSHASYYYSMPRLATTGELFLGDRVLDVSGTTWMDHEFFTGDTPAKGVGWDWFSCRLDDGRDLMLYLLRYPDGSRFRSGTLVEADGSSRPLDVDGMELSPGRIWTSPQTGTHYPVSWELSLPAESLELRVEALLDAQEVHAEQTVGFGYWEGLSRFSGSMAGAVIAGEGFVELTGYAGQD